MMPASSLASGPPPYSRLAGSNAEGSIEGHGGIQRGLIPLSLSRISAIWPPSRVTVTRSAPLSSWAARRPWYRTSGILLGLNPNVPEAHLSGAFDLKTDIAVFSEFRGIIINENRHHVTIDDMNHFVTLGDDVNLVPVVDFDITAQSFRVA